MQIDTPKSYAFWLIPREDQASQLQSLIHELANRYQTPSFIPHVTLCSGQWSRASTELCSIAQAVAVEFKSLALATAGIGHIDRTFQYFYIAIHDQKFEAIAQSARALLQSARTPKPCPHLSLMYSSDYGQIDRAELAKDIQGLVPDTIAFDRIACVMPRNNDWSDIAGWQELGSYGLAT